MNHPNEPQPSTGSSPIGIGRGRSAAIVGAGLSGLTCARDLADRGFEVRVFDKARGPGGRMATRRDGGRRFDHGAQYFTVRDKRFERAVASWCRRGIVAPWTGTIAVVEDRNISPETSGATRFVGVPGMSAICRYLALGLDVSYSSRIESLNREGGVWVLKDGGGVDIGRFDVVVVSAPAPQTGELLRSCSPDLAASAATVEMAPCWAVMATFPERLQLDFDGAFVHNSAISWVSRNASKPDRPGHESWVIHAAPDWSKAHLELEPGRAAEALVSEFRVAFDVQVEQPRHLAAHRWRFALPQSPLSADFLFDAKIGLAACGDWCGGPRVEGAFLSGLAAANGILEDARQSS